MIARRRRAPKTAAEGLFSAGSDIANALMGRRAAKQMEGMRGSAGSHASSTFERIGGGGGFPPAPNAPDMSGATESSNTGGAGPYDLPEITAYIRNSASEHGVDPDMAVRVAGTEGLAPGVWQSNVRNAQGVQEPSWGPFQLLVGGKGTGYPVGMGNDFIAATGLDPSDPNTVKPQIDFALDRAKEGGWGPWYGAAKSGIGRWDGIRRDAQRP